MGTVTLDAFYPTVIGIAPTVSEQFAQHFIKEAVIEAAKRTKSIEQIGYEDAQKGVSKYPIPVQESYSLVQVSQVSVNGICYEPTRERPCETNFVEPKAPKTCGCPAQKCAPECCMGVSESPALEGFCQPNGTFYVDSGQSVILNPPPEQDIDNGIIFTMAVAPSRYSCEVPTTFWEEWSMDIAYGALSLIHFQMGTKHYSMNQGMYFRKLWENSLKRMRGQQFINYVAGDEQIKVHSMLI